MDNTPAPLPPSSPEPQPAGAPSPTPEEQSWAIALHLSGFAGLVLPSFGQIIVPLVIWLIKRPESAYLDRVGKDVLNFQISYTIYIIAGLLLCVVPGIVASFAWLILMIVGAIKVSNGQSFQYPYVIRFLQ